MNIRVVAPSFTASLISKQNLDTAKKNAESRGFSISFSKHFLKNTKFQTAPILYRVQDIHEAFSDKNIDIVMSIIGGNSSIQLLRDINWNVIRQSSAVLCGFSDITVLQNAILAKTGKISYYGPHYSTLAHPFFSDFIFREFLRCLNTKGFFELRNSLTWGEGEWWVKGGHYQQKRNLELISINKGKAEGVIVGGDLRSFRLLQGTELMPRFKQIVFFLEVDQGYSLADLDKDIESLFYYYDKSEVKAIVFGRFPSGTDISATLFRELIKQKVFLKKIPVIMNANFGHTDPIFSFPIGGTAKIIATSGKNTRLLVKK